ncbi:hypothetical protein REPUB_Repub20aG0133000 [Reevesia pubescens]
MGVFTYETEVASPLPPAKAFKAFVLDFDNLFPKVAPHAIKSVELLEGNGGVGSIKKVTFAEGSPVKYLKEKVDGLDKENFSFSNTVFEGDVLTNKFEKICNEIKFEAAPGGGTIGKRTSKYYSIGDCAINEEEIKAGIEAQAGVFKAVEEYVLANPHY